ncbi:hypothetical protein Q5H92_16075 [Hymenobacter sp. M29]|uniref:DUF3575 domain-containing protein n=1 Tax=Hymenobacter mellowenesis TaxID=3063995 RepID=A0ABT9ADF9_9BACT|nr:hypothetical protein [Hymenobacter sp. M29]MDO7847883.1 hypothetical protein [Hymenobacter sp. M29]
MSVFKNVKPLQFAAFVLGLSGMMRPVAAQTAPPDSSRISYSEETTREPLPAEGSLQATYSRIARLQIEEQRLWKLGLNNFTTTAGSLGLDYLRAGVHLGYERKVGTAWSVMGEVSPDFIRFREMPTQRLTNSFALRSQLAGRYYYNLNRRIRKGKSASNFSANYLSLALGSSVGRQAQETPFFGYDYGGRVVRLDAALVYGLQRRLGRYGSIDAALALPFHLTDQPVPTEPSPGGLHLRLTGLLRIGLAIGR